MLSLFNLDVLYIPGKDNVVADAMSRYAYPANRAWDDVSIHGSLKDTLDMEKVLEEEQAEREEFGVLAVKTRSQDKNERRLTDVPAKVHFGTTSQGERRNSFEFESHSSNWHGDPSESIDGLIDELPFAGEHLGMDRSDALVVERHDQESEDGIQNVENDIGNVVEEDFLFEEVLEDDCVEPTISETEMSILEKLKTGAHVIASGKSVWDLYWGPWYEKCDKFANVWQTH